MHELKGQSLWVLGPSCKLANYKDFIKYKIPRENVLTISHTFFYLKTLWDYQPMYFTWLDPHQTFCFNELYHKIDGLLNDVSHYITFPFNQDRETYFKYHTSSGYVNKKGFSQYVKFLKTIKQHNYLNEIHCNAMPISSKSEDVAKKLLEDPNFRFNVLNETIIGTQIRQLENWITRLVYPLAHHYGIKNVFVLGFDDQRERFYQKGKTGRYNPIHYQFRCLKQWQEWESYHGVKMQNIQLDSPLSKFMETITPEQSISLL